jgi:hypothetical protein
LITELGVGADGCAAGGLWLKPTAAVILLVAEDSAFSPAL